MAFPMPLVVPKTRTVNLGGVVGTRERLTAVINAQSLADLHSMLVGIAREDTAQQVRLGNPPQLVEVDNRTNKPLDEAKRKIVVLFGTQLARAAMGMVEAELRAAIQSSTTSRSGRLGNIGASWQWRFIPRGGAAQTVTAANPPKTFARGDMLVLVPVNVPYATAVNRAVLNSGRGGLKGRGRKGGAKNARSSGFLAATTRAVKRRSEFQQFTVMADFTTTHTVPGEVYRFSKGGTLATGVIVIRPRFKQVRA